MAAPDELPTGTVTFVFTDERHFEEGRRLTPQDALARAHASSRQGDSP